MDLSKSPNKIFILSVVGVVVFLCVLVWLFGPQTETLQPDIPLDTSLAALLKGSKKVEEEEERVAEPIPDTRGRDPFALPYWAEEDNGTESEPVRVTRSEPERTGDKPEYKLSTILISGSNRLAVINYQVYWEGEKIGGEKISEITLDHVVLSDGSEERKLRIPQSQTKVTVESTEGK